MNQLLGRSVPLGLVLLLARPAGTAASEGGHLDLPLWTGLPFVLLLLAIALLPLLAERFWHRNRNKALVAAALAVPVVLYLIQVGSGQGLQDASSLALFERDGPSWGQTVLGRAGTQALLHALAEYAAFIVLLASLYTVSGGIVLRGDLRATPLVNTTLLALGALLANLIGTTGASMLLIRPVLQINRQRRHTRHLPVFFIFLVSNLGGLLTPLGDPPLFLGFLNGVDFLWTMSLWPQWLVANGIVLALFFVWDALAYRRESVRALAPDAARAQPLRVQGLLNFVLLAGILLGVVFQSRDLSSRCSTWLSQFFPCPKLALSPAGGGVLMAAMALASLWLTPARLRQANGFSWAAITEVAVLFAGIFITMIPALAWLSQHGPTLGIDEPWQYFWISGGLSSFLDNAPTYLTFATLAAGPEDIGSLARSSPLVLQAISCGSVFMGANTYIGNGPNFMVKALAEEAGFQMPSFLGYLVYSSLILLPVFGLVTFLFF